MGGKWDKTLNHSKQVISPDGIAITQTAGGGGNLETKIIVAGEMQGGAFENTLNCHKKVFDTDGIAPTQTASMGKGWETKVLL